MNFFKFFIGCYIPIVLEIFIYETYLYLKPDYYPDFIILIITLPMILPLIFWYFVSPYIIFYVTRSGKYYSDALHKSIDDVFIAERSFLTKREIETIKSRIKLSLIPELTRKFRSNYVNSYFSQDNPKSHNSDSNSKTILNFYETIFLFSFFSIVFSFLNAIIIFYSFNSSFVIEGVIIIDQIENLANVILFAGLMLILAFTGLFLLWIVSRRILIFIPLVIPGWVNRQDIMKIQILEVQSILDFNFDEIITERSHRTVISNVYHELLKEKLSSIVVQASREQVGRKLAWQMYNEILEELGIDKSRRERIEESFLSSPLIKTATQFAFDSREAESLKEDLAVVNSKIEYWDEQSDSEKLSTYLLLYRASESLFRGILRSFNEELGSFGSMTITLAEIDLLTREEQILLNQVRVKRNHILHRAGERISIEKSFARDFLQVIENLLLRAEVRTKENTHKPN